MRILIFADLEGASGIGTSEIIQSPDPAVFEQARALITADVNAAARGLRRAGATQIDMFDGHGMGGNIIAEALAEEANYLGGGWMTKLRSMIGEDKIKGYDALVLLGQHAGHGTQNGFLSHTNTGVSALKMNGKFVDEAPQIAWLAGYFGVPTLMIVGDDALAREVDALLPGARTIVVKESESRTIAHCLPTDEALKLIEETAYECLKDIHNFQPFIFTPPYEVEILFAAEEPANLLAEIVNFRKTDERVVSYVAKDYLDAFFAYHSCRPVIQASYRTLFLEWFKNKEGNQEIIDEFNSILLQKFKDTADLFPVVEY